ncbi:MAG: sn-glycerol-3-phosphate transport system permease protein UgpE [Chloroflexi bacterium]|nr:sn-glycerol-3-phosphate transport system permease protein UgpE [Chloroflexota bacterium]
MQLEQAPVLVSRQKLSLERLRFRGRRVASKILVYVLLAILALLAILPFLWMASTSLKTVQEASTYPPPILPAVPQWHDFADVYNSVPMLTFFRNTVFYSVMVTIGQLVFCSTAAFAFARLRFPGREVLFLIYLATLMIPTAMTLVPSFILMKWFHWLDTIWVMTIPGMFGSAFGTFLLRQFMLGIPRDLDEAATIDGAGLFRIYWQIVLPLTGSALTVLAVLTTMTVWNDFAWPLVMLNSSSVMTLTLGLAVFATGGTQEFTNVPLLMAAATMTIAPLILIFFFAQRYFVRGIALSGFGGR